jgi:hypothetical protein
MNYEIIASQKIAKEINDSTLLAKTHCARVGVYFPGNALFALRPSPKSLNPCEGTPYF